MNPHPLAQAIIGLLRQIAHTKQAPPEPVLEAPKPEPAPEAPKPAPKKTKARWFPPA